MPAALTPARSRAAMARDPRNQVRSLLKGLRVLEAFTTEAPQLALAEVARRAGLDNATAFRLLNTLERAGYVVRGDDGRRFRLGFKVLDLGHNVFARTPLADVAMPILKSLVGEVSEAASVAVPDGLDMVYVARAQAGLIRLGTDIHPGSRVPAWCSAVGLGVLAFLDPAEADRIVAASRRPRLTERTITEPRAIRKRLAEIRSRGFALSDQEVVNGLRVLAAPVREPGGHPVAAVSVAAPTVRLDLRRFEREVAPRVLRAAADLGRALAARGAVVTPSLAVHPDPDAARQEDSHE